MQRIEAESPYLPGHGGDRLEIEAASLQKKVP